MATGYKTHDHNGTPNPLAALSDEQLAQIGKELDELHDEVKADLGDRDARYIRGLIALQRRLALLGRVELFASRSAPAWWLGMATLSTAKILENMEIGHNVMHGQWDWMNDPVINSQVWDWDTASTKEAWKHSHNYIHHTYTNILGKDRDLGYEIMRIDPHQKWHPAYLLQPVVNVLLMLGFEWGVAAHDLDFTAIRAGEKSMKQVRHELKGILDKGRLQAQKDYVAWPALSAAVATGIEAAVEALANRRRPRRKRKKFDPVRAFLRTYAGTAKANVAANVARNVWSNWIIFCGHFPDQTYVFSEEEVRDETPGGRYVRQLLGAANITGGQLFHVMSGNLGYQVEHHLYPDMPSSRYGEIAPRVRDICKRYGLPYNTGPFSKQLGTVQRTILRLAFPGGKPRPKPGPWQGETFISRGERELAAAAEAQRAELAAG
ncbi:MAG TPA: acyl-CoA desaturase [Solirubrobacteraceae bacterium]|jgi:linoleoyl-CoA desaturase|nr:acyl-CoA desaturase [Solirubrobacteraceae bacterium]